MMGKAIIILDNNVVGEVKNGCGVIVIERGGGGYDVRCYYPLYRYHFIQWVRDFEVI